MSDATHNKQPRIEHSLPANVERIGMVARWRPVHLGHSAALRALCNRASTTLIGIGSSNRYNARNPFTLEETIDMLKLVLEGRDDYELIPVPDLDDGPRWRLMVMDIFGPLDLFVTANPYVASLLRDDYQVVHPVELVPPRKRVAVEGRQVRLAMASGDGWQALMPEKVAAYIEEHGLDERFRREFGLRTLAMEAIIVEHGSRHD